MLDDEEEEEEEVVEDFEDDDDLDEDDDPSDEQDDDDVITKTSFTKLSDDRCTTSNLKDRTSSSFLRETNSRLNLQFNAWRR